MPIKGLTDRESLAPCFPRLGKLRKGGPKPAKGFGKDLDHFRFTSDQPEILKAFAEAYGPKPQLITGIYLPYKTPDENFETWREEYVASGLMHRCDGEIVQVMRTKAGDFSTEQVPCPYIDLPEAKKKCIIVGRLSIILPGLIKAGFVGHVVLETHSNNDLRIIMAALMAVTEVRPRGLQGIPFILRRYQTKISTPAGNGKRARRDKWLVALEPEPAWVESRLNLARAEAFAALPETIDVVESEVIEPEAEPYPEQEPTAEAATRPYPESEPEYPVVDINTVAWALEVEPPEKAKGVRFGEMDQKQLEWVRDNTESDTREAALILLHDEAAVLLAQLAEKAEDGIPY